MTQRNTKQNKSSSDRSLLPGGPASIWISRDTHARLVEHARSRGRKVQWVADQWLAMGVASGFAGLN